MPSTIIERRIYPRYEFSSTTDLPTIQIKTEMGVVLEGEIQDISASGVGLIFREPPPSWVELGTEVQLQMSPLGQSEISCEGKLVRKKSVQTETHIGLEFKGIPLIHQQRLKKTIEDKLHERQLNGETENVSIKNRLLKLKKVFWMALILLGPVLGTVYLSTQGQFMNSIIRGLKMIIGDPI